jgi:hypothetical protein
MALFALGWDGILKVGGCQGAARLHDTGSGEVGKAVDARARHRAGPCGNRRQVQWVGLERVWARAVTFGGGGIGH